MPDALLDTFRNLLRFGLAPLCELEGCAREWTLVVADGGATLGPALRLLAEEGPFRAIVIATPLAARPLARAGVPLAAIVASTTSDLEWLCGADMPEESVNRTLLIAPPAGDCALLAAHPGPVALFDDEWTTWIAGGAPRALWAAGPRLEAVIALLGAGSVIRIGAEQAAFDGMSLCRGTVLDERWAPELNPFNTLELRELARSERLPAGADLNAPSEALRRDFVGSQPGRAPALRSDADARTTRTALAHLLESPAQLASIAVKLAMPEAIFRETLRQAIHEREAAALDFSSSSVPIGWSRGRRGPDDGDARLSAPAPRRHPTRAAPRIAALVPIEPHRGGLGTPRSLDSTFAGKPVLQRTLERLGLSRLIDEMVLLAPDDFDVEALIDRASIRRPVFVERCGASPFTSRQQAVIAARLWSDTSWRGGIADACIFDEVLDPAIAWPVIERRRLSAVVLCGPDWPLVDVSRRTGVDVLVARHLADPRRRPLVTLPAPPGLSACVVGARTIRAMAERGAPALLGELLDDSALAEDWSDAPPPFDARLRHSLVRATFDVPRYKLRLRRAVEPLMVEVDPSPDAPAAIGLDAAQCVGEIEHQWLQLPTFTPPHLILELCTGRFGSGRCTPHRSGTIQRPPMTLKLAERILAQCAESRDCVLTLAGVGDPLRHPEFDQFIALARKHGVRGVHLRTELAATRDVLDRLLACDVDVVSVDLHATSRDVYRQALGFDRFELVLANLAHLRAGRRRIGEGRFARPWIVPRLQRRAETVDEAREFVSRWRRELGAALVEGPVEALDESLLSLDQRGVPLASARTPARALLREGLRRMTILSDGRVPIAETDLAGEGAMAGSLVTDSLLELWRELFAARRRLRRERGERAAELRTAAP